MQDTSPLAGFPFESTGRREKAATSIVPASNETGGLFSADSQQAVSISVAFVSSASPSFLPVTPSPRSRKDALR